MIKKKFLLPNEHFFGIETYLITTILGAGNIGITFYDTLNNCGGMANMPFSTDVFYANKTDENKYEILHKSIKAIKELGSQCENIAISVHGVENSETASRPDDVHHNTDKIIEILDRSGMKNISKEIHQKKAIKIYFKNWDNSFRILETQLPCFSVENTKKATKDKINVLIVDDSSLVLNILKRTMGQDDTINIIGTASDAFFAAESIVEKNPDVIILDIIMPQINGLVFLKTLMAYYPKPVIIFSTLGKDGGRIQQQAFELGAVDVIDKRKVSFSDAQSFEMIKEKIKIASRYLVMYKA